MFFRLVLSTFLDPSIVPSSKSARLVFYPFPRLYMTRAVLCERVLHFLGALSLSNKPWWEKLLSTGSWKLMSSLKSEKGSSMMMSVFKEPGTRTTPCCHVLSVTVVTVDRPGVAGVMVTHGYLQLTSRPPSVAPSSCTDIYRTPSWCHCLHSISCASLMTALSLLSGAPWLSWYLIMQPSELLTGVMSPLIGHWLELWALSLVTSSYEPSHWSRVNIRFNAGCDQGFEGLTIER